VKNARREIMTITSPAGRQVERRSIRSGSGTVSWVPSTPGRARLRLAITGMDGSTVTRKTTLRVLSRPPTVRLTRAPGRAVVGRRIRFKFKARHAMEELVEVSTQEGTFTRHYLIRTGTGIFEWTPTRRGRAVVHVRARGRQRQVAKDTARLTVVAARRAERGR